VSVIDFSVFKEMVTILPKEQADFYRNCYIEEFVSKDSEYFEENIQQLKQCPDGLCYSGYLWDCLKKYARITEKEVKERLDNYGNVMVMWDIHSQDKIFIKDYWRFEKDSLISIDVRDLTQNLEFLPEDLYIFDESMKWTLILTHEFDNKRRICIGVGI
jgi:hypothetical protein